MSQAVSETTPNPNQGMTEAVFGISALEFVKLTKREVCELVLTVSDCELELLGSEIEAALRETQKVKLAAQARKWPHADIESYLKACHLSTHFTIAKRRRLEWIEAYLVEDWSSPPEAELGGVDTPEARLERFCRVRHQVHICCNNCWTNSRLAVLWSEDGGLVYPTLACPKKECGSHRVAQVEETYIEKTPRPNAFDPEPKRTRRWWARIGRFEFPSESSLPL